MHLKEDLIEINQKSKIQIKDEYIKNCRNNTFGAGDFIIWLRRII